MLLKEDFIHSLEGCVGFLPVEMIAAHKESTPVSIRLNPQKATGPEAVFPEENTGERVVWCPNAFYLNSRPSFTMDPLFHAGTYYVQEASSMFIHHLISNVLQDKTGLMALDLCAAPGGKTTLLSSMPHFRLVLANEIIQTRVPVLQENTIKWGEEHVFVSNSDPADFEKMGALFDLVLVDAPCSGSGLFRKDAAAMDEWNPGLVSFCSARQKRILSSAMHSVVEGGYLLYSTCSYSKEENEDNLDHIMDSGLFESIAVEVPDEWNVVESISAIKKAKGYRFYPNKVRGEGFFCAIFQKTGASYSRYQHVAGKLDLVKPPSVLHDWIVPYPQLQFFKKENELFAVDEINLPSLLQFKDSLRLRRSGLRLGAEIRSELIPDHELSMSNLLSENVPVLDLSFEEAIAFLRKDTLEKEGSGRGWSLSRFKGIGLGWVKLVQGRVKNHYPMSWRILKRD
jgi:16S rRNA C967 or C1407 C5-methylase (RsmB/RsmF family)/NOL1/NOP2/fmu family ribosome biogenesis protein